MDILKLKPIESLGENHDNMLWELSNRKQTLRYQWCWVVKNEGMKSYMTSIF